MATSTPLSYADKAERILRGYISNKPHLEVWRLELPSPAGNPNVKTDTVMVCRAMNEDTEKPPEVIFLSTYVVLDLVCMWFVNGEDRRVIGTPLCNEDETFNHLRGLVERLPPN